MVWDFSLYLLYGLAFFTLGVAILSRDIRISELGIARIIWLLAAFGIVHGFHEWLALLEQLDPAISGPAFQFFRLVVVSLSFLFLLYFGLFLNIITFLGDHALETIPRAIKTLIGASALSLILLALYLDSGSGRAAYTRISIALPGGLLSGIGLIMYSRTVRSFSKNAAINFICAGSFMGCYAILAGIIPSDAMVPLLRVEIILFRGVSALGIMFFTIRALSVFNLEQRELINERLLRFSQSEKLTSMGILAAGIAHEINNPLTNVSLNLEMLRDLLPDDDERIERKVTSIERNVSRASQIARELLDFSGNRKGEPAPIDINEPICTACNLLKQQDSYSIITQDLRPLPKIMGIPWKLEEVFINLLLNSLQACSHNDSIRVATTLARDRVQVIISDSGHGIGEEDLFKVFDPFYTTKEIGKGTGLGLSVCYNIVQQHKGEISLTSSEHGGTVVTLSFPVINDDR